MIIVAIQGGLGNQMWQYAFYLKQKHVHGNVKYDKTSFYKTNSGPAHVVYQLDSVFGIKGGHASRREIRKVIGVNQTWRYIIALRLLNLVKRTRKSITQDSTDFNKESLPQAESDFKEQVIESSSSVQCGNTSSVDAKNRIKSKIKKLVKWLVGAPDFNKANRILETPSSDYDNYLENYLDRRNVYYQGYWSNVGYFSDIMETVRKAFTFKKELHGRNIDTKQLILDVNTCSVSIHIRRGDYVNSGADCVTPSYYVNAVKLLYEKVSKKLKFFVFSDDIDYTRDILAFITEDGNECYFVDWNKGRDSYIDMQLMSLCNHNIITNSTFSWWASILNVNEGRIIISPKHYYKTDLGLKDDTLFTQPEGAIVYKINN